MSLQKNLFGLCAVCDSKAPEGFMVCVDCAYAIVGDIKNLHLHGSRKSSDGRNAPPIGIFASMGGEINDEQ